MKSHLDLIPTGAMTREEWLNYRHSGLGASEVGAILGLDDYTSSLELFHYKIGDAPKFDTESMASFMGREQEDLNAKLWQYWDGSEEAMIENFRAGRIVRRCRRINAFVRNPKYPWLYVSLDRVINKHADKDEGSLELKNISGWEAGKWEAGLPPKYVTQVQTQLAVCEFTYGEMSILQDARRMFVLPFDVSDTIVDHILTRTKIFWDKVCRGRKLVNEKYHALTTYNQRRVDELNHEIDQLAPEPDGTLVYAEYLSKKYNRVNYAERRGTASELAWAQAHREASDRLKEIQEMKQHAENNLKRALGDHQVLDFGSDGKVYWSKASNGVRIFRNKLK